MTKTWFKLALRAIGVLLIGLALPGMVQAISNLATYWSLSAGSTAPALLILNVVGLVPPATQLALGVYLFTGAKRVVMYATRGLDTTCARCGYSLEGITGDVCPECSLRFRDGATSSSNPAVFPAPPTGRAD